MVKLCNSLSKRSTHQTIGNPGLGSTTSSSYNKRVGTYEPYAKYWVVRCTNVFCIRLGKHFWWMDTPESALSTTGLCKKCQLPQATYHRTRSAEPANVDDNDPMSRASVCVGCKRRINYALFGPGAGADMFRVENRGRDFGASRRSG